MQGGFLRVRSAVFERSEDLWCARTSEGKAVWDGVDFEPCFRIRVFDGYIPLVFLVCSASFLALHATYAVSSFLRTRRRSDYLPVPDDVSAVGRTAEGSRPIAVAEAHVLQDVAESASPDWTDPRTQEELLGPESAARQTHEPSADATPPNAVWQALLSCKKDLLTVALSFGLAGLGVSKSVAALRTGTAGNAWLTVQAIALTWAFLLALLRLVLATQHRAITLTGPIIPYRGTPELYLTLEKHLAPWYIAYGGVTAFVNLRSAILNYSTAPTRAYTNDLYPDVAIFVFATALLWLEFLSPRPSRFSDASYPAHRDACARLPAPEVDASLFSLVTFSFLDPFLLGAAFPKKYGVEPISPQTIPDLRPDDKTARVLLGYRQSVRNLESRLSRLPAFVRRRIVPEGKSVEDLALTSKLVYHFWPLLVAQFWWAMLPVFANAVPPIMLNQFLTAIAARQRGEHIPSHVLALYAWITFVATIAVSIGRVMALLTGRRICIRLRSLIVGEVFTKALRRKDQAGHSVAGDGLPREPDIKTNASGETPSTGPTIELNNRSSFDLSDAEAEDDASDVAAVVEELEKATSGKIINLISNDAYQLSEIGGYLHYVTSEMPGTLIVSVYLLYRLLGATAFVAIIILVLMTPLQGKIGTLLNRYQQQVLAASDERLALVSEVIGQIRIVKFFAWEQPFLAKMDVTRRKELAALWKRGLTIVGTTFLALGAPIVVSVAVFVTHTQVFKRDLPAETAFTALVLLQILRAPLEWLGEMTVHALQAHVSLCRFDECLHEQETQKYAVLAGASSTALDAKVGFHRATFTWADETAARGDASVFQLRDLDLVFPPTKLSLVLGPVGSGKSTLLLSLLGETNRLAGTSFLPSPVVRSTDRNPEILSNTTAYAAQSPWLLSASIRDNIVFGARYNAQRYRAVLEACALTPDLAQLELGDETEVGEKGTVLSGGQKARVSLARAIYSSARVVLLDDVLSAVDSHTAQHLVENCLQGPLMYGRTCVLVTHAVDLCLPVADFVVSLEHGRVTRAGAPAQVKRTRVRAEPVKKAESDIADYDSSGSVDDDDELTPSDRHRRIVELRLVKDETAAEGSVKWEVYKTYLNAFGGWAVLVAVISVYGAAQVAEIAVTLSLRYWASAFDERRDASASDLDRRVQQVFENGISNEARLVGRSPNFWLGMYGLAAFVSIVLANVRGAFFYWRGLKASTVLYDQLISRLMTAPIRFFDSTPSGRILNRLSRDVQVIDENIPTSGMFWTYEVLATLGILIVIFVNLPAFLLAGTVIAIAYVFLGFLYVTSSRQLKRLESVSKSPIFSVFGESLQGVATIRAYGDASRFMKQIFELLDDNNRPFFIYAGLAQRWLSFRVDFFGGVVALVATIFIIFSPAIDAARAGFILSFALTLQEKLLWVVRLSADLEVEANSVERVHEYLTVDQESQGGVRPPAHWPSRSGSISVNALTASYAPELDPVLKGVSFEVRGGEKVGIVGRTGSGKSSLALSFFRFIEPSSGNITIDGLNINDLRLEDLRSRLTIVAQDAALFAGTLRFNLDPFGQYDDAEVWNALERVQLVAPDIKLSPGSQASPDHDTARELAAHDVGTLPAEGQEHFVVKSLDMEVSEGGKNFSAGQRQLISLAWGILKLKSSSILILDESTASLDSASDERIQQTIRAEMAGATILCIAHRLRTIIDYDKVLVLDHGVVLEYDSPMNLLAKEDSAFAALCRKSGEFELLKAMAQKAESVST